MEVRKIGPTKQQAVLMLCTQFAASNGAQKIIDFQEAVSIGT